jgi:hypothetical protein
MGISDLNASKTSQTRYAPAKQKVAATFIVLRLRNSCVSNASYAASCNASDISPKGTHA